MSTWGSGGGWAYSAAKPRILERDHWQCQLRYPGCLIEATEVDHITNIARLGIPRSHIDDTNLQAACHYCHGIKTAAERRAGQQRTRARRAARKKLPTKPHPGD